MRRLKLDVGMANSFYTRVTKLTCENNYYKNKLN